MRQHEVLTGLGVFLAVTVLGLVWQSFGQSSGVSTGNAHALLAIVTIVVVGILSAFTVTLFLAVKRLRQQIVSNDEMQAAQSGLARDFRNTINDLKKQNKSLGHRAVIDSEETTAALQVNLAKSEFLASISHEMRTPMTGILGMAKVALSDPLPPAQQLRIRTILHSGEALLAILNNVLDQSKLDAGRLEIEDRPYSPTRLFNDVVDALRRSAEEKGLRLSMQMAGALPPAMHGDPVRVRQVLFNLLENAIKFSHQGAIVVSVVPEVLEEGQSILRIAVSDQGIGISTDAQYSLFRKFTQGDASFTRQFSGNGLGLSISQEVVTLMGGEIGVESEPNEGSTFWFTLPLNEASGDDVESLPTEDRTPQATRRLNLLVAEDNLVNQTLIRALLGRLGHHLTIAENGAEALKAMEYGPFDLVLMDIRMPVMNGIDAAIEIRNLPDERASIPVIALTADAMPDNVDLYLQAGMNAVITKPVELPHLLQAMDQALGEKIHSWRFRSATSNADSNADDDDNQSIDDGNEVDALLARITALKDRIAPESTT